MSSKGAGKLQCLGPVQAHVDPRLGRYPLLNGLTAIAQVTGARSPSQQAQILQQVGHKPSKMLRALIQVAIHITVSKNAKSKNTVVKWFSAGSQLKRARVVWVKLASKVKLKF